MTFSPNGKHLIAGEWVGSTDYFESEPAHGPAHHFSVGTPDLVNRACEAAEDAFLTYGYSSREERAAFLEEIAEQIEARAEAITEIGTQETGLPEARLEGERKRTTGQLRLFATHIRKGDYLDCRHDPTQPERTPLPRPDIKLVERPIGPVAVFGASNFPLAFSTAGGDTAAALAAGCPVIVKGHSSHPGTGEIVAEAILAAIEAKGVPAGVFSLVQGGRRDVGQALVQHPKVNAVGFTGSLSGGRALFDLCAARPDPIPFFGELGSVNPMFLMPGALASQFEEIGKGWAGSLTMGAGQFCTKPGIAVVIDGPDADAFTESVRTALSEVEPQVMLNSGIASAYRDGLKRFNNHSATSPVLISDSEERSARPNIFETTASSYLNNRELGDEVFGPMGLIVRASSVDEMENVVKELEGQLTVTIHMASDDLEACKRLLPLIERKAGRVLVNGFPTGVEVVDSMVHGGPYPASTNFGATSVGTLSIRRFLRPVCYQNLPDELLPEDLR